jgi:hypothetical protein
LTPFFNLRSGRLQAASFIEDQRLRVTIIKFLYFIFGIRAHLTGVQITSRSTHCELIARSAELRILVFPNLDTSIFP